MDIALVNLTFSFLNKDTDFIIVSILIGEEISTIIFFIIELT